MKYKGYIQKMRATMLSNAMLSLLLSDFPVLPPHDAVNMAAANSDVYAG